MDETDDTTRTELDALRIRSQADLQRMWELLMQPLGFRTSSLWVTFIGSDDRPTRLLVEITDGAEVPGPQEVANLYDVLGQVIREEGDDLSVAFLVTRPGRGGLTDADRRLAAVLLAGARAAGIRCRPVHVADDLVVRTVAPDDLAA